MFLSLKCDPQFFPWSLSSQEQTPLEFLFFFVPLGILSFVFALLIWEPCRGADSFCVLHLGFYCLVGWQPSEEVMAERLMKGPWFLGLVRLPFVLQFTRIAIFFKSLSWGIWTRVMVRILLEKCTCPQNFIVFPNLLPHLNSRTIHYIILNCFSSNILQPQEPHSL